MTWSSQAVHQDELDGNEVDMSAGLTQKRKRVLIIGGTGFMGRMTTELLAQEVLYPQCFPSSLVTETH